MEQSKFYQIKNVTEHEYTLVDCDGSVITRPIQDVDRLASTFTIKDAKDGDVLYSLDSCRPFIYKERKPFEQATAYCGINKYGKFFVRNTKDCIIVLDKYVPTTKEQRDILMKAISDAGYMWDADKKELKKVEQEYHCNGVREPKEATGVLKQFLNKENHAWSEEDKVKINRIVAFLENLNLKYLNVAGNDILLKDIEWLKSLKDRVRPKVELTQLDKNILEAAIAFVEQNNHFNCWGGIGKHTVLSALRSLRPRNNWKPSEEQMDALETAVSSLQSTALESLYQDLKKL